MNEAATSAPPTGMDLGLPDDYFDVLNELNRRRNANRALDASLNLGPTRPGSREDARDERERTGFGKESRHDLLEKRLRLIEDEIHAIEKGLPKPSKEANQFWEAQLERLNRIAERLEKALESNLRGKGKHSPLATELMRRRHELKNYMEGLKMIASLPPEVASSPAMLALIQEANEYISKAQRTPLDPDNVRELRPKGKEPKGRGRKPRSC